MKQKKCTVRILPARKTLTSTEGQPLLEALMRSGIFLRNDCGGKGTCGKCRVNITAGKGESAPEISCQYRIHQDITVNVPASALSSSHIMNKADLSFPPSFCREDCGGTLPYGAAVDLGTTTIAVYLCSLPKKEVIASIALKNPQSLYGADVMSRITAVAENPQTLTALQELTVKGIQWGLDQLLASAGNGAGFISKMVVAGNPTMIHILAGEDPSPIGTAPYQPAFYEARQIDSLSLNFKKPCFRIRTLPNVAGFLGGDILAAAQAADMDSQPDGTLLADLGTNGELLLKQGGCLFSTSCATGPAFEGATLTCGIQAIPGAVNGVDFTPDHEVARVHTIADSEPVPGICGAGVVNAVAQFRRHGIIRPDGRFASERDHFTLVPENPEIGQTAVTISQKDIRAVQLGKSALITGIEFLLDAAGLKKPEKLIIAGAFGSYLSKSDLICLGMIPDMPHDRIVMAGNLAGSGAVMAVCDPGYIGKAVEMAQDLQTVDLACSMAFQQAFVDHLGFP